MNWLQQAIWWGAILTGCSQTIVFNVSPAETLRVSVYSKGRPVQECAIAPGSPQQQKLSAWLSKNTEAWAATPATYVPGVKVSGENFSVNFLGTGVILNYAHGQYSRSANPSEYEFLLCDGRT